ncbi:MAG: hypothetical protein JRI50_11845 [Deltaproteobacteria bacterium]|nr:hypothetical protein [Deltaproteobacteria bacterium]
MGWWRREEGDNPSWPGLVDVFAFTLVFIMLLWFGTDWWEEIKKLEDRVKSLERENATYKLQVQGLKARIKQLEKEMPKLEGIIITLLDKFYKDLKPKSDRQGLDPKLNLTNLEITITGKSPIYFGTARYDLSKDDQERLVRLAHDLYELLQGEPYYILINGTADPRELRNWGVPPRDNTELSALRAATVAGLLEKSAPGLGRYLRVVGLGVKGEKVPLTLNENPDEVYRKYRTVELVIKVDMEKVIQNQKPESGLNMEGEIP